MKATGKFLLTIVVICFYLGMGYLLAKLTMFCVSAALSGSFVALLVCCTLTAVSFSLFVMIVVVSSMRWPG